MTTLTSLESTVGHTFTDRDLLQQVFIHRSYLNESPDKSLSHNERLEFLGDAVLELVVTRHLYDEFDEPEGVLTNWRAALVRGAMIATVSEALGFNDLLLLSKGEQGSSGKARGLILANTFEAFVGALYLDGGYDVAAKFIHEYLIVKLPTILEQKLHIDPKSQLQEILQTTQSITPTYTVLDESGPDHAKTFTVGVFAKSKKLATGTGHSKQQAEVDAAHAALAELSATQ